jgi:hypothetical protein
MHLAWNRFSVIEHRTGQLSDSHTSIHDQVNKLSITLALPWRFYFRLQSHEDAKQLTGLKVIIKFNAA